MSDPGFCKGQVMRLKSIDDWLDHESRAGVVKELTRALATAENDTIAFVVINAWVMYEQEMPTPADLVRLVATENAKAAADSAQAQRTRECARCGGTGFEIVERGGYSGAQVCRCRAGRAAA